MDALFQTTYLELALREYAERVRERYRENLARNDHHASGNLMSTIRAYVEVHGTTYEACLDLQDYWKYVEEDTPGTAGLPYPAQDCRGRDGGNARSGRGEGRHPAGV